MKILAFAATNHKSSINRQLIDYSLSLLQEKHEIKTLDLSQFEVPLFAPHRLEKNGLPVKAQKFADHIKWADLIIISFAEYNGSYTPVFKNLLDWASTTKEKLFAGKELVLMATSPGKRGAQGVLSQAQNYFPFMGGTVLGAFSLPSFNENFSNKKITHEALRNQLQNLVLSAEVTPVPTHTRSVRIINQLAQWWVWAGYGLLSLILINGWLKGPWFAITASNIFWEIAMFAATFTLIIRPIYDLFPESDILRALLKWRKGVGLVSSGIVVGFFLSRNISFSDPNIMMDYFSPEKWSLSLENLLERTTEITAFTLFLISNKYLVLHFNRLWRNLQKLAYVYFLSAASLLTFIHEKNYGLLCLILFLVIYLTWTYKRLLNPEYDSHSTARRSQAS